MNDPFLNSPHKAVKPDNEADVPLNFDTLSFEELGRAPICQDETPEEKAKKVEELSSPEIVERRLIRRCDSAHRELTRNWFPEP